MERTYGSAEEAERLARALAPDQGEFVRCERRGGTLLFEVESETPSTARATVEDLLACLGSAERAAGVTGTRRDAP